jgi:enoyl-CoA hydratase/carnithine racemase
LLSNVVEAGRLLDVALELAADMLATTPHGLRLTKQALELNTDAPSMEAAMALEDRQQVMMSAMEDFQEAKAAFLEKRPADFRGG